MENEPKKTEFDQEDAIANLTLDLSRSFADHFDLPEASAYWMALRLMNHLVEEDFIDTLVYERKANNASFLKVDKLAGLFEDAIAEAFDMTEDEASGWSGRMMEQLELSSFINEMKSESPVTVEDVKRLTKRPAIKESSTPCPDLPDLLSSLPS